MRACSPDRQPSGKNPDGSAPPPPVDHLAHFAGRFLDNKATVPAAWGREVQRHPLYCLSCFSYSLVGLFLTVRWQCVSGLFPSLPVLCVRVEGALLLLQVTWAAHWCGVGVRRVGAGARRHYSMLDARFSRHAAARSDLRPARLRPQGCWSFMADVHALGRDSDWHVVDRVAATVLTLYQVAARPPTPLPTHTNGNNSPRPPRPRLSRGRATTDSGRRRLHQFSKPFTVTGIGDANVGLFFASLLAGLYCFRRSAAATRELDFACTVRWHTLWHASIPAASLFILFRVCPG